MKNAAILGLALAGLAYWLGNRAAAALKGVAHGPGDDASKSFRAGIADENSIPDAMPAL